MPEYELRLRFTAADAQQADRLAYEWADTCAAEYGTRYAGCHQIEVPSCCCGTVSWERKWGSYVAAGVVHRVGEPCYVIEDSAPSAP